MGKISQGSAEKAAVEICKPLQKTIDQKKKEMGKVLYDIVVKDVPKEVMEVMKKYKEYVQKCSGLNLMENGFNYKYVGLSESIPRENGNNYYKISGPDSKVMHKLINEIDDLEKQYKKTKQTIENTLLTLGTHKRVEVEYPEAYPYVAEKPTNTGIMLNIAPIRQMTCALVPGCKTEKSTTKTK